MSRRVRSKLRRVGFVACAAIVMIGASAFSTSPSGADDLATPAEIASSLLTVRVNGAIVPVQLQEEADVLAGTEYGFCCGGGITTITAPQGWSIGTILTALNRDPSKIESVAIQGVGQSGALHQVTLSPADFDPGRPGGIDFPQATCRPPSSPVGASWSCPAFVYVTNFGFPPTPLLNFFRPQRTAPPSSDQNVDDRISTAPGAPGLTVDVTTTDHLDVHASANHKKVEATQAVQFSSSVEGSLSGEQVKYAWSFGDGKTDAKQAPTHSFAHPGAYSVTVVASGNKGSGGVSSPIIIVVGKKAGAPGPGGATSTSVPATPGGDHGDSNLPPVTPTTTPGPGSGHSPNGIAGGRSTTGNGTSLTGGRSSTDTTVPAAVHRPAKITSIPGAIDIRGELLTGSSPVDAAAQAAAAAGLSGAKQATGPGGTHVPSTARTPWSALLGIGAVLALYLLGATTERRPRWLRRFVTKPAAAKVGAA